MKFIRNAEAESERTSESERLPGSRMSLSRGYSCVFKFKLFSGARNQLAFRAALRQLLSCGTSLCN